MPDQLTDLVADYKLCGQAISMLNRPRLTDADRAVIAANKFLPAGVPEDDSKLALRQQLIDANNDRQKQIAVLADAARAAADVEAQAIQMLTETELSRLTEAELQTVVMKAADAVRAARNAQETIAVEVSRREAVASAKQKLDAMSPLEKSLLQSIAPDLVPRETVVDGQAAG